MSSHYETLGISTDAPIDVVRAAYRVLALKYHPDRNPHNPSANGILRNLNHAFEVLSDSEKRREYDESILNRPTISPSPTTSPASANH